MLNQIMGVVRRIAYEPTRAERKVMADVILQQITRTLAQDKFIMAVAKKKNAAGIILAYDPAKLKGIDDESLATMLAHETQHLRAGDLDASRAYVEPRDWFNGWDGCVLHNVARDMQINDELIDLGFKHVPGMLLGMDKLGHDTQRQPVEAVMREFAASNKAPPPNGEGEGEDGDGEGHAHPSEGELGDAEGEEVSVTKAPGTEATKGPANVSQGEEQARWANFLATVLDTRNSEDRWHQQPKRLSGVAQFARYEAALPRRQPLPRKSALMAIDVSGSMDEAGVQRICTMVRNSPANYDLTVICFDTGADEWKNFRTNDTMPRRGGGTEFALVEEFAQKMSRYPDSILCITDGGGEIPKVRNSKVWTWVLYGADAQEFQSRAEMRTVELETLVRR
jgi:predicted metal-dependent peptidase